MTNRLIYGKAEIQGIVAIEVVNDTCTYWTELDGKLEVHEVPNRFWLLSDKKIDHRWNKLEGDLHYQYGRQFTTREEFTKCKNYYRNKDIYTINNAEESFMVKDGVRYFLGLKPKDVSILSFDIETTGLKVDANSKVLIISNTYRFGNTLVRKLFDYSNYANCGELISDWSQWVQEINPTILCGHNIIGYDLKFLYESAKRDGHDVTIGRDGSEMSLAPYPVKFRVDGGRSQEYPRWEIFGREICDTMMVAIRYDVVEKKYESYGLKPIIKAEGLEKEGRQFYDASQIRNNYKDPVEWAKIIEYCKEDSDDALALFDLMIPSSFYVNQSVPKTFTELVTSATGSQINAMLVGAYLQDKHSVPKKTDLTTPLQEDGTEDLEEDKVEGGISFAVPGIYRNLIKVDLRSAYPSQVLRFKLFDKDKDPKGLFYELVYYFTYRRFDLKKKFKETGDQYYKDMDAASKVFINSAFGLTNTNGLNFNSPEIAGKITEETRKVIDLGLRWASGKGKNEWMQEFFNLTAKKGSTPKDASKVLHIGEPIPLTIPHHSFTIGPCDTDSFSYGKPDGMKFTNDEINQLSDELASISPEFMEWELDGGINGQYETCIALKAKNYILYDGKKTSRKGSALKSSTKEFAVKEFMNEIIDTMLTGKFDYENIYDTYVREALNVKEIKRWASKKTISDKVMAAGRTNEQNILSALEGMEFSEGDKIFFFYKKDNNLCAIQNFTGDYDEMVLVKKLHTTAKVFANILPTNELFPNLALKKAAPLLEKYKCIM